MSFVNAAAALGAIDALAARIANLGTVSQNAHGTLLANVTAANKALDEISKRSRESHEEFMKWARETQTTRNFQTTMTEEQRSALAGGGIPPGFTVGPGGSLQAPPGTLLSAEEQMMLLRGGVGPGFSRGGATSLETRAGPAWGESLSPESALMARQLAGEAAVNMQEANAFADQLEAAVKRFEAGFPNSYFTAVVLAMEIPYLRIGARSAAEARRYIMAFQPAFLPGFQAALQNPNLPAGLRGLTQEAIQILMSGTVSGGGAGVVGGTLTVGPRPRRAPAPEQIPPYTTAEEANVAGISGGIGAAGAAAGAGLGATLGRIAEGVFGIQPLVRETAQRARETATLVNAAERDRVEANRRLADQFSSIRGWQQRVETSYMRPTADGMVEVRRATRLGAAQSRELADALERLQLSGALSPGSTVGGG